MSKTSWRNMSVVQSIGCSCVVWFQILSPVTAHKGKVNFLQLSLTMYKTTLKGRPHTRCSWPTQNELNVSRDFLFINFVLFWLVGWSLSLSQVLRRWRWTLWLLFVFAGEPRTPCNCLIYVNCICVILCPKVELSNKTCDFFNFSFILWTEKNLRVIYISIM